LVSTIRREWWIEHLKKFFAGNLFTLDTKVEVLIDEAECLTPTFSELKIVLISESASQSELESGNTSNESGLEMIFKDWFESDRRLEGNVVQVTVTSLSELGDLQSVKPEEGEVIDRGSTAWGQHLN